MPQCDAGLLIEPPVSVPNAISHIFAATAAPEPDELPPGILSQAGFFVAPNIEFSPEEPHAKQSIFVIPIIIPSSAFIFAITSAS